jgi:hypothetical protein
VTPYASTRGGAEDSCIFEVVVETDPKSVGFSLEDIFSRFTILETVG